jgi:hypothetical protein
MTSSYYSDFLMWANPVQTGAAFVSANLLAFVVLFCSPLLTLAYIGLTLMAFGMILNTAYPGLSKNVPDELVSSEQTTVVADLLSVAINAMFREGKSLFFWTDALTATRAGVALYVLKFISPVVSVTTLVLIGMESMFLLPLVWQKAQLGPKVTPHLALAKAKLQTAWDAIPRAKNVKKD